MIPCKLKMLEAFESLQIWSETGWYNVIKSSFSVKTSAGFHSNFKGTCQLACHDMSDFYTTIRSCKVWRCWLKALRSYRRKTEGDLFCPQRGYDFLPLPPQRTRAKRQPSADPFLPGKGSASCHRVVGRDLCPGAHWDRAKSDEVKTGDTGQHKAAVSWLSMINRLIKCENLTSMEWLRREVFAKNRSCGRNSSPFHCACLLQYWWERAHRSRGSFSALDRKPFTLSPRNLRTFP